MKPSRLKKVVITLLLILVGGVSLFVYGFISAGRSMELVVVGKRVQGIVTRIEPSEVPSATKSYFSIVSFSDEAGKTYEVRTVAAQGKEPQYALGSYVTILYVPKRPEAAKINDNSNLWLWPILGLIVSNLLLIAGCFLGFVTAIEVRMIGFTPAPRQDHELDHEPH